MNELSLYVRYAPVASVIFAITIVTSLLSWQKEGGRRDWMLHPYSIVRHRRYLTLITSGLIHADWLHLLFNMITFYYFAFPLEMIMVELAGPVGHLYFAILYVVSMVLADIHSIIKHKDDPYYFSLGASGAVAAVIFAMIFLMPEMTMSFPFFPIRDIPGPAFGAIYLIFSAYAAHRGGSHINNEAHFWGSVAGLTIAGLFFPDRIQYFLEGVRNMFG